MPNNLTTEQIVRRFLNPAIKGRFADALVAAVAAGDDPNALNVLAAKDQLMIATATGQYLDVLFGRLGVIRPPQTGIDDNTFRDLGVAITNNKLVSNVFLQILEAFYGQEAVSANMLSVNYQPYNLADGMQLIVRQDSRPTPLVITFHTSDFQNINAATAQEVSDSISRQAFDQGYTITAVPSTNTVTSQTYVQMFTGTLGPKGALTVLGGQAQNTLNFPTIDPTTQSVGTQLTLSISGGNIRFTWTGGPDPGFGALEVGDYANVFGAGFSPSNRGTFTVEVVQSGTVGNSYFEVQNPNFVSQAPVTLAAVSDILFFHPSRVTINSLVRKASVYEINPYEIVVLLPVTTKIIKRQLIGSAHLNPSIPGLFLGSYIYDTKSGFKISSVRSKLNTGVQEGQVYTILDIGNTKGFPANGGFLVFDYGYATQEGPVKYLAVASKSTLLMDPAYKFKQDHGTNSVVNLVSSTAPFVPATDGSDYQFYVTDSVNGRVQAEKLINQLTAAGITVTVIIVFPSGPGLVSVQDAYSDSEVV